MLTEDYISFETAKLFKKKGLSMPFNSKEWICCMYDENGNIHWGIYDENWYFRITHQMALKWLREVHNLFIEPRVGEIDGKTWYDFDIIPINGREIAWNHYNNIPLVELNSYEETVETAIKYCLENLI